MDEEFNVLNEFFDFTDGEENANVEVISSGVRAQSANVQQLTTSERPIDNCAESSATASTSRLDEEMEKADEDEEIAIVDEHGFTDADYARIFECDAGEEILALINDEKGENAEKTKKRAITDFPIDPTDMTFDFVHEWYTIQSGRKDELMTELLQRLVSRYQEVLAEDSDEDENEDEDAEKVIESLLNAKLETFAKLGVLDEMNEMAAEFGEKLDFSQIDRCGVPLLARLCVFPCNPQTHEYCQTIDFLLSNSKDPNADVNRNSKLGSTALMIAAKMGEFCKVIKLLKAGAYVNVADRKGRTALTLAAERGHEKVVRLLICNGASCESAIWAAPNALTLAERNGHANVGSILKKQYKQIWDVFRDTCNQFSKANDDRIKIMDPVTPLFTCKLRESPTFTAQFIPDFVAYERREGSRNLLFMICIEQGSNGHFVCQSTTQIKTVRLNGEKEISVTKTHNAINVVTMLKLNKNAINDIKVRFEDVNPDSQVRLLLQGFVCDLSKILSGDAAVQPDAIPMSPPSSPVTPMPTSNSFDFSPEGDDSVVEKSFPVEDVINSLTLLEVFGDQ